MADKLTVALKLLADPSGLDSGLRRGQSSVKRFTAGIKNEFAHMGNMLNSFTGKLAVLGGGVTIGSVLAKETRTFADTEHHLRGIGNAGNIAKSDLRGMGNELLQTAVKTNQFRSELVEGIDVLVGSGMKLDLSRQMIGDIGDTATGTQAAIEDLSKTAFSLNQNLKIQPNDMRKSLEILTSEGYAGSFELKDMARYFPLVTAQIQKMGYEGPKAAASLGAALQVAKYGAGTNEEAATNLSNYLTKITSKDLTKNFEKNFNIDWESVFKNQISKAEDPLLASVEYISKVVGDDPFKINQLFGDMQVMNYLTPTMKHLQEYKNIRDAKDSKGIIDKSKANMMDTSVEQAKRLKIILEDITQTSTTLNAIWSKGTDILKSVNDKLATEKPSAEQLVGGGAAAVVGGYALSRLGGGIAKSLFGTAGGLAAGAALEGATGVQSVFVTNWPAGGLAGGMGKAEAAVGGGLLSRAIPQAAAAGAGFWGGLELGKDHPLIPQGSALDTKIRRTITNVFAAFGNQQAIAEQGMNKYLDSKPRYRVQSDFVTPAEPFVGPAKPRRDDFQARGFRDSIGANKSTFSLSAPNQPSREGSQSSGLRDSISAMDKLLGPQTDKTIRAIDASGQGIEQRLSQLEPQLQSAINGSNLAARIGEEFNAAVARMAEKKASLTIKIDGPGRVTSTQATGFNISVDSGPLTVGQ